VRFFAGAHVSPQAPTSPEYLPLHGTKRKKIKKAVDLLFL